MGQTCEGTCDCGGTSQAAPNTESNRTNRRGKLIHNSSYTDTTPLHDTNSTEYFESDINIISPKTQYRNENTMKGFKNAIENGNDSLAMFYVNEYPNLNLLNIQFENGDNCLHIAVRNHASKLIYYLLTNGVSVNYKKITSPSKHIFFCITFTLDIDIFCK